MTDDVVAFKEKVIIFCALLAGLPLAHLDVELLGFRRFVWLGASVLGLISLLVLDPQSSSVVDSMSFALLSTALVPHLVQLIKDQSWLGMGVLPPFFMATYQSTQTPVDKDSEEYWQVRCFLHLFAFTLPYLNHLPSGPPPPTEESPGDEKEDDQEEEEEDEDKPTTAKSKSSTKSSKKSKSKTKKNR